MNISLEADKQHLGLTVAAGMICFAGIIINTFIGAVNITDWMKRKPVTTADQLLTSFAVSSILFQSSCLFDIACHTIFVKFSIIYIVIVMFFQYVFFYINIWISAIISVFFCLKISNFHNNFFQRLKPILLQRVIHLIIASVMVTFCYMTLYFCITNYEFPKNASSTTYHNIQVYMFVSWNVMLFLSFLMPAILLLFYLCNHTVRMRRDRTAIGDLLPYYKTINFSTFSIVCYGFYFVATIITWCVEEYLDAGLIYLILNVFPTIESIYLVYVTTKLSNRVSDMIQHGRQQLFNRKLFQSNSRGLVETITQLFK